MKKYYPFIILFLLVTPALACGLANWQYRFNNEVRLAIFEYARKRYGPVDDLVIHFDRGEPRIRFNGQNQNGGHTVWLYQLGAREYFATRPAQATYLYIQKIEYNDERNVATVDIYYGDGQSYQGRRLTLMRNDSGWTMADDVELSGE